MHPTFLLNARETEPLPKIMIKPVRNNAENFENSRSDFDLTLKLGKIVK